MRRLSAHHGSLYRLNTSGIFISKRRKDSRKRNESSNQRAMFKSAQTNMKILKFVSVTREKFQQSNRIRLSEETKTRGMSIRKKNLFIRQWIGETRIKSIGMDDFSS